MADRLVPGMSLAPVGMEARALEPSSDEALAAQGDADCLVLLYRRYSAPVYRYLYARTGDVAEAEDLTSTAWERVVESLSGYRPTGSFRSWLFTIAARTLADHYRRRKSPALRIDGLRDELLDTEQGPEDAAVASDEARWVIGELRSLGPEQQEVLTLRFMVGLSYTEIARVTGKKEAAVKMMAYRALADLRKRLVRDE